MSFPNQSDSAHNANEHALEEANKLWNNCLEAIKPQISTLSYKTWFQPIKPTNYKDNELTVKVPSQFFYDWLEEHYGALIRKTICQVINDEAKLLFVIGSEDYMASSADKEMELSFESFRSPFSPHIPLRTDNVQSACINLNPRYNFDNFIKGDCNQLARAAAMAVANNPGGTSFNPLVIYGGTGLGKTHLMHALGNYASQNGKAQRTVYISSEKFTLDFVEAIQEDRLTEFSSFYRTMDLLIVDDIQFFSGKEKTQDNFFHTFNVLHQLGKQIVLSSDVPPKELKGLDDRLISRFQSGLTADIQPPDFETRIAILQKKSTEHGFELPIDVLEFIAANITKNIRELEGCLISLYARASLENLPINIDLARSVLNTIITNVKSPLTIEHIQKLTSEYFDIPLDLLRGKTRRQEVVLARQTSMYLAKELTNASLKTIGIHFGGRDHSTVIHACQSIEELMRTNYDFKSSIEQLRKKIELSH